jgi:hypothetical protein
MLKDDFRSLKALMIFSRYVPVCHTQLGNLLQMSIEQRATKKKPGFRPGVCVKNNKLYAFSKVRVVVVRGWPEMAA